MMKWKTILTIIVALAIAATGLRAYAAPDCPMHASSQHQVMKDCPHDMETSQNKTLPTNNCCDDAACAAQCAAMSSLNIPVTYPLLLPIAKAAPMLHPANDSFTSLHLRTPEHPPKALS